MLCSSASLVDLAAVVGESGRYHGDHPVIRGPNGHRGNNKLLCPVPVTGQHRGPVLLTLPPSYPQNTSHLAAAHFQSFAGLWKNGFKMFERC